MVQEVQGYNSFEIRKVPNEDKEIFTYGVSNPKSKS
jgi:hypothetical protein